MKKVVLTGGPCAGKTTAITRLSKEFSELGFQVFVVPEAATLLIQMGIRPFGEHAVDLVDFQKRVMHLQMTLEDYAAMSCTSENSIILCDRGILDDKAYVTAEDFKMLAETFQQSELDFMNRYDLVLHLKTVADGKKEFYTLENNQARTETAEEARALDRKTLSGWLGHRHLKVIGNNCSFEDKINSVLKEVYSLVKLPVPIQRQRKFLVKDIDLEGLNNFDTVSMDLEQYVIKNSKEEKIYRKIIKDTSIQYVLLKKIDTEICQERIVREKEISKEEYLENYPENKKCIYKKRSCFVFNDTYYRLDQFMDGTILLEVDYTNSTSSFTLPPFILEAVDVTDDFNYRNSTFYQKMNQEKKDPYLPLLEPIRLGTNVGSALHLDLPEITPISFYKEERGRQKVK